MKNLKNCFTALIIMLCVFVAGSQNLEREYEASFLYFWEQTNTLDDSPGYGLVRDRFPGNPSIASIAAVGFGLTAIPIGVEEGWIGYEDGFERASRTLDTFLKLENFHGFFFHFLDFNTGERAWNCEISTIDTAIFLCGALTAGEYFGGEVAKKASALYERVNWNGMIDYRNNYFYMAYYPEKGFQGFWDFYAEQLMLYVLAAGAPSPKYRIDPVVYYSFKRYQGSYKGERFIHSWFGSLFTYQFSHAWIDFRDLTDGRGVNWFENSVRASLASYNYCKDNADRFAGFAIGWGVTACDGPGGYDGLLGTPPSGNNDTAHRVDGTLAPAGALGSIVFLPDRAIEALEAYYELPELVGRYGLKDSFNLDLDWFASDYIGIDKGITLLMISNYRNDLVWNILMESEYIIDGLDRLGSEVERR
jgi:hypothetical protein